MPRWSTSLIFTFPVDGGIVGLLVKFEGRRIDAVSLSGGWRTVVKGVSKVGVATFAADLDATHTVTGILPVCHRVILDGRPETRPTAARVVLFGGTEQRHAATYAMIDATSFMVIILAGECRLGAALSCDSILLTSQHRPPLGITLFKLLCHEPPSFICIADRYYKAWFHRRDRFPWPEFDRILPRVQNSHRLGEAGHGAPRST